MAREVRQTRAAVVVMLVVAAAMYAAPSFAANPGVFVEESLVNRKSGSVSVIVTARDSRAAAAAVRTAGGRVTSDLWIVNAVAASVPAHAVGRLSKRPGIVSVVENKKVQAAAADWNGWVTDLRVQKGQYTVGDLMYGAPTHLPGGGFAQVMQNGEVLIVNADGSERARVTLTTGGPFYGSAGADPSGRIFVPAVYGVMYGLSPDGQVLWQNATMFNTTYFYPTPVVASDGTVVVVAYNGVVYGFDPDDGTIRWQQSIVRNASEYKTSPIIGPDDTMYVSSAQGDVFAVTSTGGVRWSASINGNQKGSYIGATPALRDGTLYVNAGSKLVAFDAATGTQRFAFTADSALLGSPNVAPDGGIVVASANKVYAISPTGQTQWTAASTGNVFIKPPLVSPDNSSVYVAINTAKGKAAYGITAFKRASGLAKWPAPYMLAVATSIATDTVIDADGGVIFGGSNTSLYRVDVNGVESHRIKTHTAITHLSQASDTGNIVTRLDVAPQLLFAGRLPNAWNGRADVEPGSARGRYKLVNPYTVDIGADQVHKKTLAGSFVKGAGVTVAVVDSGVYWDPSVKSILGPQLQHQFAGQADFIDRLCGLSAGCTQSADYAFYDFNSSRDTYGHGTHVAGTISNKLLYEILGQGQNGTEIQIGVAPDAKILSIRVLGADGTGSYETVVSGIQYVVENKDKFGIRVLNLSISAFATVPYFVDPLNRAVERAWQKGIVVLAAAGNVGPFAQTITVPGNDPYVITVGAVNSRRTAGYWRDDVVAGWSATGPTHDGFVKPDILAPGSQIVSYMYNDPTGVNTPTLVRQHPDYSADATLFRMNGTSMATGVASGVVALMLQANPGLTPDQVKFRLMDTARWSVEDDQPVFNTFQQGLGRIWAPDAVFGTSTGTANTGMDLDADLAHGYETLEDLAYHYQGPVQKRFSDAGDAWLYYYLDGGEMIGLGASDLNGHWLTQEQVFSGAYAWDGGTSFTWAGGLSGTDLVKNGHITWGSVRLIWGGVRLIWGGVRLIWGGTIPWAGGSAWGSVRLIWGGSVDTYAVSRMSWATSIAASRTTGSNFAWIGDEWTEPPVSSTPPPAGTQP